MLLSCVALADVSINMNGFPVVDKVMEFTTMVPRTVDQGDWNEMWIYDHYEEVTGIRWKINMVDSAAWAEQKNLAFATGDLPDAFASVNALTASELISYGSQGYLIDLNRLLADYTPHYTAMTEIVPEIVTAVTTPEGKIYSAPTVILTTRELDKQNRVYMNMQWLENLGLSVPGTTDELYDVLMAFKEKDADGDGDADNEIPFGGRFEGAYPEMFLLAAFGLADNTWDVDGDGQVLYVPASENYFHYLEYMKKLWDAKLIDEEFFSQTDDQFNSKAASVKYGFFRSGGANWTSISDPAGYLQYKMFEPITSDYNGEKIAPAVAANISYGFSITDQCEYPEVLARWLDYTYTPEGSIYTRYGSELGKPDEKNGWSWELSDAGVVGMRLTYDTDKYSSYNNWRMQVCTPMNNIYAETPVQIEGLSYEGTPVQMGFFTALDERQVILTNDIVNNHSPYYKTAYPVLMLTDEESEKVALYDTDLSTFVKQMAAKFITGDEALTKDSFDAYVKQLDARGLSEYTAIQQAAYDR